KKIFYLLIGLFLTTADVPKVWADDGAKLAKLEEEVAALKRLHEIKKEDDDKKPKDAAIVTANLKDGFQIKSVDNSNSLRIRGLIQTDGRVYTEDYQKSPNQFRIRRARIIFQGTVAKDFDYYIMPDFGNGTAQLTDAYLDYKYSPALKFRAGKFKSPFALERLQTDSVANFIELGLTGNLSPNRDIGF